MIAARVVTVALVVAATTGCVHVVSEKELLPGAHPLTAAPNRAPDLSVTAQDGSLLRGYAFTGPGRRAVAVYFGGNGEIVSENSWLAELGRRHGIDVYALNYRGFGPSEGTASLEALVEDSTRVFDAVAARPEVAGRPIVVYGTSLGTLPALEVATQRRVDGAVLQGAPSAAAEVIPKMRRSLPWYARAFVRLRASPDVAALRPQPIDLAPSLTAPLLSIHGNKDTIVAIRFGREVFDAAKSSRKTFCEIEGAGHNDIWSAGGEKPHDCLEAFLKGL